MNSHSENTSLAKSFFRTLWDILLMYVVYFVCRAIFLAVNYSHYAEGVFGDEILEIAAKNCFLPCVG